MDEVVVEVIGVLGDAVLQRTAHGDVVERGEVLHVLAEPHATGMGTYGDVLGVGGFRIANTTQICTTPSRMSLTPSTTSEAYTTR